MSWESYVDQLTADGVITKGAIIGLNGSKWTNAKAPNILDIKPEEAAEIARVMNSKNTDTVKASFASNGVKAEGVKYMFLRDMDGDGRIVTAKKSGVGNLIVQSTNQTCIIAHVPEANTPNIGNANNVVDRIARYLEGSNY